MIPEMRRTLPSFEQWLNDNGDGSRGDGFEGFSDLARRTQEQSPAGLTRDEASMLRMWQGLAIAITEVCNVEIQRGRTPVEVIQMMPRSLACGAFYSAASVLKEETPWRSIAKILTEEFRHSAKVCADQYTESLDRQNSEVRP